ncbi:MAG: glucose 1-dehydrogenase [Anaerolineales bacterium]|nr:glucose 1-dehydrogenase [Anaerolineales bacterium]
MERQPLRGRFADQVVIVTGGASGIGRAVAQELAREGAAVVIADLSPAGAACAAELEAAGGPALFVPGDLADEAVCAAVVAQALARFGRLDGLVNNAFSFIAKGLDATHADWERMFAVGPIAYSVLAQHAAPAMRRGGGGAIVNLSSISAFIAQPNRWTYNAAKGAVHTLTKCMAFDLAPFHIRVNSVSPGWIWTQEVYKAAALDGGGRAKWDPIWGEYHMLRRCGDPVEVAAAVLFLLSADASFITAADLAVDGGYMGMGPEGLGQTTVLAGSQ